jgi:type VI secretion system secreted protein Hcp
MSNDWYLKNSKLKGSAKTEGHKDEIEVMSIAWGVHCPINHTGTGLSGGKSIPSSVTIVKKVDNSSTLWAKYSAAGDHVDEMVFTATLATGAGKQEDYFKITLKDCMVASYQISGSMGGQITEAIAIDFKEIKYELKEQTNDGKLGAAKNFSWDTATTKSQN